MVGVGAQTHNMLWVGASDSFRAGYQIGVQNDRFPR